MVTLLLILSAALLAGGLLVRAGRPGLGLGAFALVLSGSLVVGSIVLGTKPWLCTLLGGHMGPHGRACIGEAIVGGD